MKPSDHCQEPGDQGQVAFLHAKTLCLIVYEAKGLKFDDVILYDFFTKSSCQGKGRIIGDIEVETGNL